MFDELVKRLRAVASDGREEKCDGCPYEEDYPCCVDCLDKLHNEAYSAIEELQKAVYFHKYNSEFWEDKYNSLADEKWIPVTERLPEKGKNVIVASKRGKQWDVDKAWLSCLGSGFDRCGKRSLYHVTYWMPLPEPPKEG